MSHTHEELLHPADERCADVRELMLVVEQRDLTELESLRVERHVDGCASCLRLLEGRHGLAAEQDRLVRSHPAPAPSDAEWAGVEARLSEELGLPPFTGTAVDSSAPPRPVILPTPAAPGSTGWGRSLLPVAASILLTALVVHNLSKPGDVEDTGSGRVAVVELPSVEVHDLPADQSSEIYLGGEDEEGVVVFFTSDEE